MGLMWEWNGIGMRTWEVYIFSSAMVCHLFKPLLTRIRRMHLACRHADSVSNIYIDYVIVAHECERPCKAKVTRHLNKRNKSRGHSNAPYPLINDITLW